MAGNKAELRDETIIFWHRRQVTAKRNGARDAIEFLKTRQGVFYASK